MSCNNAVYLKDLRLGWPDCTGLTEAQRSIIAYLKAAGFDTLRISAPSWRVNRGTVSHHANTNSVDFTADAASLSELFRAWEYMRRKFPGQVLLGVHSPENGYTALMHLHVGGTWSQRIYSHGFETLADGKGVVTVNHKDFAKVWAIAAKVYGWKGSYQEVQPKQASDTAIGYTLLGALIGGGVGYPRHATKPTTQDWMRTAAYIAAGAAAGYIVDQITTGAKKLLQ